MLLLEWDKLDDGVKLNEFFDWASVLMGVCELFDNAKLVFKVFGEIKELVLLFWLLNEGNNNGAFFVIGIVELLLLVFSFLVNIGWLL